MKIVFIGAGNLATCLALEMNRHAYNTVQVYSRTMESARLLAGKINARPINDFKEIDSSADLYIFSVKDSILPGLLQQMPSNNGIWIHTAGSVPINIFEKYSDRYGVVYPFQTFSKDREIDFGNIPFFMEANGPETFDSLKEIFGKISRNITELSSEKRKYLHLTGVFACNFVNHMYRISSDILEKEGIPFESVLPLIEETASKIHSMTPEEAQTGPAIRFDENIIKEHIFLLDDEHRKEIYALISKDIHETNSKI